MYLTIKVPESSTDDANYIQTEINDLPTSGGFDVYITCDRTLDIARPILPGGTTNAENNATRRVIFHFDPGAAVADNHWFRFNAPCVIGGNVVAPTFANKSDACPGSFQIGGGALTSREPGISGYSTTKEQAFKHERGRAASYFQASTAGSVWVPGVSPSNPAIKTQFNVDNVLVPPYYAGLSGLNKDLIRIGSYIDLPGRSVPLSNSNTDRAKARITARVTQVKVVSGGLQISVDGWYVGLENETDGFHITDTTLLNMLSGRDLILNPVNKVWGQHINVFLSDQNITSPYGRASGSFVETGLINLTGQKLTQDFDRFNHPLHFYGFDAAIQGVPPDGVSGETMDGGVAFLARGKDGRLWYEGFRNWNSEKGFVNRNATVSGFENRSAPVGFHNEESSENTGGTGFANSTSGTAGAGKAFVARAVYGPGWDEFFVVKGDAPVVSLGRTKAASQPRIDFQSSGQNNEFDARVSASGGTSGQNGQGTLNVEAKVLRLLNLPTSATGLPTGAVWRDANGFLRIV